MIEEEQMGKVGMINTIWGPGLIRSRGNQGGDWMSPGPKTIFNRMRDALDALA